MDQVILGCVLKRLCKIALALAIASASFFDHKVSTLNTCSPRHALIPVCMATCSVDLEKSNGR